MRITKDSELKVGMRLKRQNVIYKIKEIYKDDDGVEYITIKSVSLPYSFYLGTEYSRDSLIKKGYEILLETKDFKCELLGVTVPKPIFEIGDIVKCQRNVPYVCYGYHSLDDEGDVEVANNKVDRYELVCRKKDRQDLKNK